MTNFNVYSLDNAPAGSKPLVEGAKKAFGFVPNLIGVFAESPAALEGYLSVSDAFDKSDFSAQEKQIVLLATSVENECSYCVAAHTTIGGMQRIPASTLDAVRDGRTIDDPKLEALRAFTTAIVRDRGRVSEAAINNFLSAGYSKRQLLDVITGVTQKTLSNYLNHIAATPLDAQFEKAAWTKETVTA